MKKSTKKALSLLLAVTMVVGLLTGCGSTKSSDGGMSYLSGNLQVLCTRIGTI